MGTNDSTQLKACIRKQQSQMAALVHHLKLIEAKRDQILASTYYDFKSKLIMEYWGYISRTHHQILNDLEEAKDLGYDPAYYLELESWSQEIIIELGMKLEQPTNQQTNSAAHSHIKLPKITLPIFKGDYLSWIQFRDLYVQLIHTQEISNAEKMFYLTSNLTGEAKRLIQHLPVSDQNYQAAWELLEGRYNNKRLLVSSLLDKLLNQPTVQQESAAAIKTLHDTTKECIMGLANMGVEVSAWNAILVHIILKKLDSTTHNLYEQGLEVPREIQGIDDLLDFLELRFQSLEALGSRFHKINRHSSTRVASFATTSTKGCVVCAKNHPLFYCKEFLDLATKDRLQVLRRNNLCLNCMKSGHIAASCTSRGCLKCAKRHNTLVHTQERKANQFSVSDKPQEGHNQASKQTTTLAAFTDANTTISSQTLLSTVRINIFNKKGMTTECRAILDSGSQIHLITERLQRKLGLEPFSNRVDIGGIGDEKKTAQKAVNITIGSRVTGFKVQLNAFVLKRIISYQPTTFIDVSHWKMPKNLQLADPTFNTPQQIDLLIGAELFYQLLSVGQIQLGENAPTLQNTVFGWVVSGPVPEGFPKGTEVTCSVLTQQDQDLTKLVEKFWARDDIEVKKSNLSLQEVKCETHFNQTVRRNKDGRFVCKLPFQDDAEKLGESSQIAARRLMAIERKLAKHEELRTQYVEFMNEYLRLGHMKAVNPQEVTKPNYFLPHHCVIKPDSTTTKLRVVFDASAKSSTNVSLNDILATGPTIQNDLFTTLLRFRLPRYVFTADIEKMYRQILIDEEDQKYQLILWRNDPNQPIQCYKLCTVTYGMTSAPYLATKCLQRLAVQEAERYPLGSTIVKRDFYIDDLMTGQDNLHNALEAQQQLNELLTTAGFKLRKWCSNHKQLLQNIKAEDRAVQLDLFDDVENRINTLGLTWLPQMDKFQIKASWPTNNKVTKRIVLSDLAHLFDPLGLMSPVVVIAKLFLQNLWKLKLDWDAALPMDLHSTWCDFRNNLNKLNEIQIPRHMFGGKVPTSIQLHAFSDASEKAYGVAIYLRSTFADKTIKVHLLCAKSRVAPVKPPTLPRLELYAATLMAEFVHRVKEDLNIPDLTSFYWTDSEIVLAWINSRATAYHAVVAKRIATIQELTTTKQWRHVSSKQNPADVVSRGMPPTKLASSTLWFYGPLFLYGDEKTWPQPYTKKDIILEAKAPKIMLTTTKAQHLMYTINHENSFEKWQRIMAYVLKFIKHCRQPDSRRASLHLTMQELNQALVVMAKQVQLEEFHSEVKELQRTKHVSSNSPICSLTPFLDDNGVVRVGGRLEASNLSYDAKHPILIPYAHPFSRILMTHLHKKNLHVAPQALLAITRQRFWPLKGKTIARSIVQGCVRCARSKPKLMTQLMGNLPALRVQPARPFLNAGVDFFGPCWIHYKLRGKRPQKSYIAVFCCFATKATHFEVVTDLTTEAFIGALKRFTSRRGNCRNLHCDNATNFVGARNKLEEIKNIIYSRQAQEHIIRFCTSKGIDFHFIPPRAPHFGGLWEAAVKSAKNLLQPCIENASLTYEELETLIIEIEAILNSRPLTPLSSHPEDLTALTPGHFLIGEPPTTIIDPEAQPQKLSLLSRWRLVSHLKLQFWQRWSSEYLNELQHRYKWKQEGCKAEPGMMVVIKEDNLPASSWMLGRIKQTIKGHDGIVRVADVKTANGVLRRPIHKLAPLPIECTRETSEQIIVSNNENKADPTLEPPDRDTNKSTEPEHKRPSSRNADREASSTRKKPRTSSKALALTLLTCLIMPIMGQLDIKPFTTPPGLYFENMGDAHLVSNEWNMVVYYNLSLFWTELDTIKEGMEKLTRICGLLKGKQTCIPTVEHFSRMRSEIDSTNELLHQTSKSFSRTKRGAVNVIGNVANALFGVLDSEYADHMNKIIKDLNQNDDHLLQLIKNQTSVIDSTINIIRKSNEATERQIQEFNNYINLTITQLSQELQQEKLTQAFNALSVQLTLMIINYQRTQSSLIDVAIDTHHGKINPQLITPSQLFDQLTLIQDHIPPTLRLPTKDENLLKLYNIMSIQGRMYTDQMIFRLKLPLFSQEQFEMLRVVPVPFVLNKTSMIIDAVNEYMVVNLHREQYYPLSEQELRRCIRSDADFICTQHHPLYNKYSTVSACEISVISHGSFEKNCKIKLISSPRRWIQLLQPNEWIYVVPPRTIINLVCEGTTTQKYLDDSGILKLHPGCIIKDESMTIRGHNVYSSNVKGGFTPTRNLSEFIMPFTTTPIPYHAVVVKNLTSEINFLESRVRELDVNTRLPSHTHHDIHQYTIGYLGLLAIIFIVGYIFWNRFSRMKQQEAGRYKPTPMPRKSSTADFQLNIIEHAQGGEDVKA